MCCLLRKHSLLALVPKDTEQRCLLLSYLVSAFQSWKAGSDFWGWASADPLHLPALGSCCKWLVGISGGHRMHWVLRVEHRGVVERTPQTKQQCQSQHSIQAFSIQALSTWSRCCGTPALLLLQDQHIHSHSRWEYWLLKALSWVPLWELLSAEGSCLAQHFDCSLVAAHLQWLLISGI